METLPQTWPKDQQNARLWQERRREPVGYRIDEG
jgi:hypothetical protein